MSNRSAQPLDLTGHPDSPIKHLAPTVQPPTAPNQSPTPGSGSASVDSLDEEDAELPELIDWLHRNEKERRELRNKHAGLMRAIVRKPGGRAQAGELVASTRRPPGSASGPPASRWWSTAARTLRRSTKTAGCTARPVKDEGTQWEADRKWFLLARGKYDRYMGSDAPLDQPRASPHTSRHCWPDTRTSPPMQEKTAPGPPGRQSILAAELLAAALVGAAGYASVVYPLAKLATPCTRRRRIRNRSGTWITH